MQKNDVDRVNCRYCAFWHRITTQLGECHRMPPGAINTAGEYAFPAVHFNEWCAEFHDSEGDHLEENFSEN